jgi:osomolarity two-component system sensor histidine kinase SLN1
LGWITIVQDARLIQRVIDDRTGLGATGQVLLLGPTNTTNHFPPNVLGTKVSKHRDVRFLLPVGPSATDRHATPVGTSNLPFPAEAYPAVDAAIGDGFHGKHEIGSMLRTHNEAGVKVSVAYSTPPTTLVNWIVLVEKTTADVWQPITRLRVIVLACFFSILGFLLFTTLPLSHWAVRPISRLRAATKSTIGPLYPDYDESPEQAEGDLTMQSSPESSNEKTLTARIAWWRNRHPYNDQTDGGSGRHRRFRIPSKVKDRKHWIEDDLTDLIETSV